MKLNEFKMEKLFNKKIYVPAFFLLFFIKLINNLNTQKYFYGDDSWLLLGARYDSMFDSLRCCALSHPGFSLFAQTVFKLSNYSTEGTILFFLIYSNLLALLIFIIPPCNKVPEPSLNLLLNAIIIFFIELILFLLSNDN